MWWKLFYVVACVLAPVTWGLAVYAISNKLDTWAGRWRKGNAGEETLTEIEYQI